MHKVHIVSIVFNLALIYREWVLVKQPTQKF